MEGVLSMIPNREFKLSELSLMASSASEIDNSVMMVGNVKNYGAIGDGITDDTIACQNCLDANSSGGKIIFPLGTFLISNAGAVAGKGGLRFYSNQHIQGLGFGSIIKLAGDTEGADYSGMLKMSIFLGSSPSITNLTISDLQIDGSKNDIAIPATEMEGIDLVGADGSPSERITIQRIYMHDIKHDGIDLDYVNKAMIKDNFLIDMGFNGVHSGQQQNDITVTGNYIENCGHDRSFDDLYAGIDNSATNAITTNNIIKNCPRGIRTINAKEKCIIANNIIDQTRVGEYAIYAQSGYMNITGNVIYDNSGESNGILVSGSNTVGSVSNNIVRGNANGITIDCGGNISISGNTLKATAYNYAIKISGSGHTCVGNSIEGKPSNSKRGAIHVSATAPSTRVSDNIISGGVGAGACIYSEANDVILVGNTCNGTSSTGTEIVISANDNIVTCNRISAASISAITIKATANRSLISLNSTNGSTLTITDNGISTIAVNNIS